MSEPIEPAAWEYDYPSPTGMGREVTLSPPWLFDPDGVRNGRPLYRSPALTDAERAEIGKAAADEITRLRNQVEQLRSEVADAKKWAMQERSLRWAATTNSDEISRTAVDGGWVSIRDRLPPLDERVLYVHEVEGVFGHEVNAGRWDGRRTLARADGIPACVMDYGDEDGDWEPCTHWMPLPEPPPNRALHNM